MMYHDVYIYIYISFFLYPTLYLKPTYQNGETSRSCILFRPLIRFLETSVMSDKHSGGVHGSFIKNGYTKMISTSDVELQHHIPTSQKSSHFLEKNSSPIVTFYHQTDAKKLPLALLDLRVPSTALFSPTSLDAKHTELVPNLSNGNMISYRKL